MSARIRRNPRHEQIRRNRLHPEHSVMMASGADTFGPSGLRRRNPHRIGYVAANGLKRINRLAPQGDGAAVHQYRSQAQAISKPMHRVDNPTRWIAAVLDLPGGRLSSHDRDVLGQAQLLAGSSGDSSAVLAIVLGDSRETDFAGAGVDRLLHVDSVQGDSLNGYCPELKLSVLSAVESQYQPASWLFPDSIDGGADLGSRWAVLLGERPAVHAWQVEGDTTVCRGGQQLTDWRRSTPRILLLAPECALPVQTTRHEAARIEPGVLSVAPPLLEDCGPVAVDPRDIALGEAEFIVSAGNGVRNWPQFHELATALGATEGASRVAVDDDNMPRHRQVGASGTWVSARVYLAVGISGAIQHLQGIGQCETVISINLDAGCDMVRRADLSVIADSEAVCAELLRLMEERKRDGSNESREPSEGARHVA